MEPRPHYALGNNRYCTRTGRPLAAIADILTKDALLSYLRKKNHIFSEFLRDEDNPSSKLYFDIEDYYQSEPTPEIISEFLARVQSSMSRLLEAILKEMNVVADYVLATRHGIVENPKSCITEWKLSFRSVRSSPDALDCRV